REGGAARRRRRHQGGVDEHSFELAMLRRAWTAVEVAAEEARPRAARVAHPQRTEQRVELRQPLAARQPEVGDEDLHLAALDDHRLPRRAARLANGFRST